MRPAILLDARLILEKPTGIGQYLSSLVPELLRLAPDWDFHLLRREAPWPGYGVTEWRAPRLKHHVSGLRHMSLQQQVVVPRLARELGCGLLHYPHFDAPVSFGSVPVVATVYDAKYLVRPDFFPDLGRCKAAWTRLCFSRTLRRASAVLTISESTARDMHRLFGVPIDRLDIVPLAASRMFRPASADERHEFREAYGQSRPFVLSVGERRPHKNHARLIRAWAATRGPETHDLLVIGQSYRDYAEPERAAAETGLGTRVRFLEDVGPPALVAAYSEADFFAFVSEYEGFGLPILEAMACGAPVIASRTTASGDVLGDAGIAVDPESEPEIAAALVRLLDSESERRRLRDRGLARCEEFSWERTAERTLDVYRRVLEGDPV